MAGSLTSRLTACALIAGLGGCGGDGGNSGPPPSGQTIAKAASSGDAQTGIVGQALANPLQVIVTDDDVPAAGVTVTWSTSAATGSMTPTSVATDANGIASSAWALGTVSGSQTAQATLAGASGSPVSFTATAAPGAATALADAGGNNQSAAVETPLAAKVQTKVSDEFGNGVPGVAVGWAATGGAVSAPIVTSDASGISGVSVTAGATPGPITITATAEGLSGSPVSFSATATAAPPPTANVSVVDNSFSPTSLTISAGTTVVWTWSSSAMNHNVVPDITGGQPTGSGAPADGPKTYSFKFNTPGTYGYYCSVHGSPGQNMFGVITVQ